MASQEIAPASQGNYQSFVDRLTTQVIAAMPISVPDDDLKRARARFRVAFSADAQKSLQECTPESVARAIVLSAMSGLFPGGPRPDVWLIPRRNKHAGNALEITWQMSFRGYIRLARRAGWDLEPILVFEGEKFEIVEGERTVITHVRNLDLPRSWESLRYGYIRVFPESDRGRLKLAYLSKAEIQKRRSKAKDQDIWNEWPLEMALKTLCSYAGAREIFPCDDPMRHAMTTSEQAEIGSGASAGEGWGSLPTGSKTANLAARLAAKDAAALPAGPGPAIDVEGRPLGEVGLEEDPPAETPVAAKAAAPGEALSGARAKKIRDLAASLGVSIGEVEEDFGSALEAITLPGYSAAQLEEELAAEIRRKQAAAKPAGGSQLPLGSGKK